MRVAPVDAHRARVVSCQGPSGCAASSHLQVPGCCSFEAGPRAGHQRAAGPHVAQHCSLLMCSAGFTQVLTSCCCAVQIGPHAAERPQGLAHANMLSLAALRLLLCGAAAGVACGGCIIRHCPAVPDMPSASQVTPPATPAGASSAGGTPAPATMAEAGPAGEAGGARGARHSRHRQRKQGQACTTAHPVRQGCAGLRPEAGGLQAGGGWPAGG